MEELPSSLPSLDLRTWFSNAFVQRTPIKTRELTKKLGKKWPVRQWTSGVVYGKVCLTCSPTVTGFLSNQWGLSFGSLRQNVSGRGFGGQKWGQKPGHDTCRAVWLHQQWQEFDVLVLNMGEFESSAAEGLNCQLLV